MSTYQLTTTGEAVNEEEEEEKWVTHYSSGHQILLVGEGDFSFSSSLASCFGSAANICASSLDSQDDLIKKYKNAKSNLGNLKELGASILHGVDATKMKLHPDLKMRKFDRIIFNFPHAGFYGKEDKLYLINLHRSLVRGFFMNARGMLRVNGQIHVNHKTTPPFCYWNIEELACASNLALIDCVEFRKEDFPDYNNKRGAGERCDEPFPLGACSTFKFRFCPVAKSKQMFKAATMSGSMDPFSLQMQHQPNIAGFNHHIADMNPFPLQMRLPSRVPVTNAHANAMVGRDINYPSQAQPQRASSGLHFPTSNQATHMDAIVDRYLTFDARLNGPLRTYPAPHNVSYSIPERVRPNLAVGYHPVPEISRHDFQRHTMEEVPRTNSSSRYLYNLNDNRPLNILTSGLQRVLSSLIYRFNAADN